MYISMGDLALFVMFCLVTIVSVFLAITLNNLNSLIIMVNRVIYSNKDSIDKTMSILPNSVENFNDAAVSFKYTMDKAGSVVGTFDEAVIGTVTVSDTAENIFEFVKIVGSVVRYIAGVINREEKG